MNTAGKRRTARILAFQALFSYDLSGESLEGILRFEWSDEEEPEDIRAFAALLVQGTVEHLAEVDSLIKDHLHNWDFNRLEKVNLALLRMSIYSLLYQKDIPPKVVIDEAVEIVKEYGTDDSYRFVNGLLDAVKNKIYGKSC